MRKLTKMSAMLLASGLILTGCGGNKGLEEKKENKQLTYTTVKDIGDMNPHVYGGSMSAESMIYEPLVRNTKDGIKPLLAKKWDVSEDGKTYTFHLRDDVNSMMVRHLMLTQLRKILTQFKKTKNCILG